MTSGTTYRTRRPCLQGTRTRTLLHRPLRTPLRTFLLAALTLAPAISRAALDADALLKSLAHPAPAVTPFVEVRYSKLLDQPIVVKGQLEYHEDGTLVRAVTDPFKERTEIKAETVSILRAGKSPRTFSLKRAPELRSMLGGFAAVLGGSRATLDQDFNIDITGESQGWKLTLTPKSPQVGKYVRDIVIHGAKSDARCIVVTRPDDQSSVMLVGAASQARLPSPVARDWLTSFCANG
jgi:hypothetical protein